MDKKIDNFGYTTKYMTKNGKPWFPVMGEFHYSRYPREYWKESLYKMKAGGVQVVSTYNIWIHHEEVEGEYDFLGNKDLRAFIQDCKEVGIYLFLRIGPWVHAEVRNGGLPDWLLKKDFEVRTNDEKYFLEVEKFYTKLFEQAKGYFLKDDGPIIGIQIENEYGHCGGLNGEDGENHMIRLTNMAKEIGFDAPLYTATGWGGAVTGGLIPVMGGYCEAPWDQRLTDIEPSGNYIFTHERNDHNIGSDHGFGHGITFDVTKFPFLTAELGGGLQVTRHRRPIATGKDIGAMSLTKLGSGCNLLGYYMYHGGTNPKGKLTTLNESRETGYLNDLNELNYDFRASIREYGQISDTFKEIKLLSMFVADFGEELCEMEAYIPKENPLFPTNFTDLRYTVRHNGEWGYVFVNNYQRREQMATHKDVTLKPMIGDKAYDIFTGDINNGDYFFYPVNMPVNNKKVTLPITPLCKINNDVIFYGDVKEENLVIISREEALNSWKVKQNGKEQLIISSAPVIDCDKHIEIYAKGDTTLKVYPDFDKVPCDLTFVSKDGLFSIYEYKYKGFEKKATFNKKSETEYEIEMGAFDVKPYDVYLNIDYIGEMADLYIDGEKVADEFYCGEKWQVALRKFDFPSKLTLKINPLHKEEKIYLENFPKFEGDRISVLNSILVEVFEKAII